MATDLKTGQAIFTGAPSTGLRNVGSYQVAGHPFITGSSTLGQNQVQMVEFPYVAKSFTVINIETVAGNDIRVHFQSGSTMSAITKPGEDGTATIADTDNVIAGFHYVTVPAGHGALTFDSKCSRVYISQNADNSDFKYQVFAELTNIPTRRMYHLTGSGITD